MFRNISLVIVYPITMTINLLFFAILTSRLYFQKRGGLSNKNIEFVKPVPLNLSHRLDFQPCFQRLSGLWQKIGRIFRALPIR